MEGNFWPVSGVLMASIFNFPAHVFTKDPIVRDGITTFSVLVFTTVTMSSTLPVVDIVVRRTPACGGLVS